MYVRQQYYFHYVVPDHYSEGLLFPRLWLELGLVELGLGLVGLGFEYGLVGLCLVGLGLGSFDLRNSRPSE